MLKTKIPIFWQVAILLGLTILIIFLIPFGFNLPLSWPDWTGFGDYTNPKGEFQRGKTLWDWLELLIVPLVIAFGVYWLNRQERDREQSKQEEQIREQSLQSYLDHMTGLLLDKGLLTSSNGSVVRNVARSRTLTVLRGLDKSRKGILLRFLWESGLLQEPVISLAGADLSEMIIDQADLHGADLSHADLRRAKLSQVRLSNAKLYEATLEEAHLIKTTLTNANLNQAQLSKAILRDSDLAGANLVNACLRNADLSGSSSENAVNNLFGADLTNADMTGANLAGVILDETNICGANFTNANLNEALLTKTKYNSDTRWPENYRQPIYADKVDS